MKKIAIFVLVLALLVATLASAQSSTNTATVDVTVDVTVESQTWIDILPEGWNLGTVNPATTWYNYTFEVENIGSTNITTIEANNSYPTSNPFAKGIAANYNAANFLALKLNSSTTFYFANYVEYNDTDTWDFRWVTWPTTNVVSKGRFRIAGNEYLWALAHGGAVGNCTNGTIYIGTSPKTYDTLGDTDLSGDSHTLISGGTYGCWDVSGVAAELNGHMVWVSLDCTQVALVKYNKDVGPFRDSGDKCTNDVYLFSGTGDAALQPGEVENIDLRMTIPYGVRAGAVSQGTLTLTASGS